VPLGVCIQESKERHWSSISRGAVGELDDASLPFAFRIACRVSVTLGKPVLILAEEIGPTFVLRYFAVLCHILRSGT